MQCLKIVLFWESASYKRAAAKCRDLCNNYGFLFLFFLKVSDIRGITAVDEHIRGTSKLFSGNRATKHNTKISD